MHGDTMNPRMTQALAAGRLVTTVLLSAGSLALLPGSARAQIYREATAVDQAPIVASAFEMRGDGVVWEQKISAREALYVRLHFAAIVSPPNADYKVVIRGTNERALVRYNPRDFARRREFWTEVLFSPGVIVQVQARTSIGGFEFTIDKVIRQVDLQGRLTPQSVVPDWKNLDDLAPKDPAITLARSIAKLYIGEGFVCTGFMVAPNALMTNFHCLAHSAQFQKGEAIDPCSDIEAYFDFDHQLRPEASAHTSCRGVLDQNESLDYAVLKIDDSAVATGAVVRPPLRLASKEPTGPVSVFILHHPGGLATKISSDCKLFPGGTSGTDEHDCSTTGGSSGAPVISKDGTVAALHFDGAYPRTMTVDEIEKAIARGEVFRNKARPMALIRDALRPLLP
jgi:Trypsin-like peptidase domain